MKIKRIKTQVFMLSIACLGMICLLFLSQCKKEKTTEIAEDYECPVDPVIGKDNNIMGKWKLMEIYTPMVSRTEDHSCDDIVYEFRADSTLLITENGKEPRTLTFSCNLIDEPYRGDTTLFSLRTNNIKQGGHITKGVLVLSSEYLDGSRLTFVRIE